MGKKGFFYNILSSIHSWKKLYILFHLEFSMPKKNQHNFEEILAIHILIFDLTLQVLSQTFIKTYLNNNFLLVL